MHLRLEFDSGVGPTCFIYFQTFVCNDMLHQIFLKKGLFAGDPLANMNLLAFYSFLNKLIEGVRKVWIKNSFLQNMF